MKKVFIASLILLAAAILYVTVISPVPEVTKTNPVPSPVTKKIVQVPFKNLHPEVEKVMFLYFNHSDEECRKDMTKWLTSTAVMLNPDKDLGSTPAMLATYMAWNTNAQKQAVVIGFTPDYPYTSTLPNPDNVEMLRLEKESQLLHEYIHVKNHFSGKYQLTYNEKPGSKPADIIEEANFQWGSEYEAYGAQYEFLEKHDALEIMFPGGEHKRAEKEAILKDHVLNVLIKTYQGKSNVSQKKLAMMIARWKQLHKRQN